MGSSTTNYLASTPFLMISIALASLIIGVALQRIIQLIYLNSTNGVNATDDVEQGEAKKPMTYDEAMQALAKVSDAEPFRRRRKKRKAKPEPVLLSALRYGEYHTDNKKLKIQVWRPDPTHRLAGHVVIDIIPKPEGSGGTSANSSVRRLAIDLDTVEATRLVTLRDGLCVVLAVRDYEVKGQGVIFKDLQYSKDIGVDDTTLYVLLVVRNDDSQEEETNSTRLQAFRRLAKGLFATTAGAGLDDTAQPLLPSDATSQSSPPRPHSLSESIDLPDVDIERFFSKDFDRVF